eukprot:CAMPEP_0184865024 /NCGR_PEP_ID=MMETSP0580-20130426/16644_1 /TAXON_ID=1118495 /ORGANISM="Dactyliosolen fragilissimus" /LENGTH=50 /DNA_ID=CAMNT_0027364019 /DNA_START=20 /DNA_END=169 /DNA_ORIENTATION=-
MGLALKKCITDENLCRTLFFGGEKKKKVVMMMKNENKAKVTTKMIQEKEN